MSIIAFIGAIRLVLGILKMTPQLIGRLSQSYPSYSRFIIDDLAEQKSDVLTGISLVSFAFLLQITTEIFNLKAVTFLIPNYKCFLIIVAIIGIVDLLSRLFHQFYKRKTRVDTGKFLLKWQVEHEWFKDQNLHIDAFRKIEESAETLLFLKKTKTESRLDFLNRLGEFAQVDIIGRIKNKYRCSDIQINNIN